MALRRLGVGLLCAAALLSLGSALTVHLVPHSHDDVGWLKTVDQYYVGSHQDIQDAAVQHILTSTVAALKRNPERKFIYVEQAFFQRWWRQQSDAMRADVQKLVAAGQWEFINGGWCMHDEAGPYYVDMIDQTTLGHQFILTEFGADHIPTIGWQIDPFGHSATQAALLSAEVGFDALFFGRIDYQDRLIRRQQKSLEMIWSASPTYGPSNYVFANTLINDAYSPPPGYGLCWDESCNGEDIQDDPALDDMNVVETVDRIVRAALYQANFTRGELSSMNIMWEMGEDFQYENAEQWYINLDRAIKAVNANGTIKLQYSTPSLYVKARNAEPVQWPTKTDDFFPYAFSYDTPDSPNSYWTGYLTSRPTLKYYIRETSNLLQLVRHFEVFTGGDGMASEQLWEAQAVVQHHDAVAGTAKQAVTFDYAQRLAAGIETADAFLERAIAEVVSLTGKADVVFTRCPLANVSVCEASNAGPLVAAVIYNPAARALSASSSVEVQARISIPVYSADYVVYAADGTRVPRQQVIPAMPTPAQPAGAAQYEAVFPLDVAGLGIETVFLQRGGEGLAAEAAGKASRVVEADPSIENDYYVLQFDSSTGLITSITTKEDNVSHAFTQDFAYYNSYQGAGQKSGAYIFRPAEQYAQPLTTPSTPAKLGQLIKGEYVQQVWQQVSDWVVQKVTLYKDRPAVEFEWTVGPIPVDDQQGKEVIIRFNSSIDSGATWYTDSNGREFQKRVRNQRSSWPLRNEQPIAGNYYPVNAVQWLADGQNAMVALNDRSQGGSSIADGSLEFMVHRRLLADDNRGVGEPLNELGADGEGLVVTGRHYVSLLPAAYAADLAREAQNLIYSTPHITFTNVSSINNYTASQHSSLSFLATDLPSNVELITCQALASLPVGNILIRLAHQFGVNESSSQSQPATVDIGTLFTQSPTAVHELSLTATQAAGVHVGYEWNTTDGEIGRRAIRGERAERRWGEAGLLLDMTITLQPLEIRTFALSFD